MVDALHPADPIYQGLKISQLRFEIEHGRAPTPEENLALVQQRLECDEESARAIMARMARTLELEVMAHDILDKALPDVMGGAFAGFMKRR